ncbi:MAG: putative protein-S-isoprenylcysteine methyltransferase-like [Nevskia sp.]|nr:putative protein-S-isoprenylcysteine methyltransferase-like [Nevskia sp.]
MTKDRKKLPVPADSAAAESKPVLTDPWFDKAMALLACAPLLFVLWINLEARTFDLPRIVLVAQILLQVGPMFVRRAPLRVSHNPGLWIFSFVTTYWPFLVAVTAPHGPALAPQWVTTGLSLLGLSIFAFARLSLGRSIGLVPALRGLVVHGAYSYVRHPIYSGAFLIYLVMGLTSYSLLNTALCIIGCVLYMIKSLIEERFLSADQTYRLYMQQVPWRWLPGVA